MLDVLYPDTFLSSCDLMDPPYKRRRISTCTSRCNYQCIVEEAPLWFPFVDESCVGRSNIFNALPDEIMEHVFTFLEPAYVRTSGRLVCQHWNEIAQSPSFWKCFKFTNSFRWDTEKYIEILSLPRFSKLESLIFGWSHKVDGSTLDKLLYSNPRLRASLTSLEIHRCHGLDDRAMKKIAQFTNMQSLRLYNSSNWKGITDEGLAQVCNLMALRTLHLSYFKRISNEGLANVKNLKNLRELHISGATMVSDTGISTLASLTNLASLTFSLCGTLTDKTLFTVSKCFPQLRYLSLGYNNPNSVFSDDGLNALLGLKQLRELKLERSWGLLSGDGIKTLKQQLPDLVVRNW